MNNLKTSLERIEGAISTTTPDAVIKQIGGLEKYLLNVISQTWRGEISPMVDSLRAEMLDIETKYKQVKSNRGQDAADRWMQSNIITVNIKKMDKDIRSIDQLLEQIISKLKPHYKNLW